jgi:hypothetical protein
MDRTSNQSQCLRILFNLRDIYFKIRCHGVQQSRVEKSFHRQENNHSLEVNLKVLNWFRKGERNIDIQ